jgi:glutaconate CoA-transferase, subunit B
MEMSRRSFVERVPFITSFGHGEGGDHRQRLGLETAGPVKVITDLCILEPDPVTKELVVTSLHSGVKREDVIAACGWPLRFTADLPETPAATATELTVLRDLQERSRLSHAQRGTE